MAASTPLYCKLVEHAPDVEGWLRGELWRGMADASTSLLRRSPRTEVVVRASRKVRCFASTLSVVAFTLLFLSWLSVLAVVGLLLGIATLFETWSPTAAQLVRSVYEALSFMQVLYMLAFIVPNCVVMFLRYWAYEDQDRVFVAALRRRSDGEQLRCQKLADALAELPVESTWVWLRRYFVAVLRNSGLALAIMALGALPTLGPCIFQVALFVKKRRSIGLVPALALMLLVLLPASRLLPAGRILAQWGLQLLLTARSASKELMYTLIGRCDQAQRRALSERHQARIIGFGLVAGAMLSIPIIGPLLWFDLVELAADVLARIVAEDADGCFDLQDSVRRHRGKLEQKCLDEEREAKKKRHQAEIGQELDRQVRERKPPQEQAMD